MRAYEPPVEDILFILNRVIDTGRLLTLPTYAHLDIATLTAVVRAAAEMARDVIAPINEACDTQGARYLGGAVTLPDGFVDAYRAYGDHGWSTLVLPAAVGGQQMPEVVQGALSEMSNGASLAFSMLTTMGRSASGVLIAHAGQTLKDIYLPRLVSGEWAATIAMTEAHAGTDIGQARTRATKRDDDSYAIDGAKIFISFADHDATEQICHIVLARTVGAPDGVRGLSVFLVPKFLVDGDGKLGVRNAVRATRLEDKMGIHGTPTCELLFDDATGYLLGDESRGIQNMFTMVNTMRLEVAFEGVGIAGAAFANAARYAAERRQGGPHDAPSAIIDHAEVRRLLMTMKALTGAARALTFEAAYQLDLSRAAEDDNARRDAADMAAFLLPVCKATCTDLAVEVASLGIQVHGGHGYIRDNGAEQLMRDARITPLYGGTNGIHAIDLATRRLTRDGGHVAERLAARVDADVARLQGRRDLADIHARVREGLDLWRGCSTEMLARTSDRMTDVLAGATPYLRLTGRLAMGWMWLRMAAAAEDTPFATEKNALARFFGDQIMADMAALAHQATSGGDQLYALDNPTLTRS